MKKILFLTQYDESGASSRHCVYDYLDFFRNAGIEVDVRPLIKGGVYSILGGLASARSPLSFAKVVLRILFRFRSRWFDVVHAWRYDLVVVQKDVLPFGLRWLLQRGQKNIVFMTDDPIWLSHPGVGSTPVFSDLLVAYRKRLVARLCSISKLVIADSPAIRDYTRQYCPRSAWLRTGIPLALYESVKRAPRRRMAVGWIGSPSSSYLMESLLPALERLATEMDFDFYNVGGNDFHSDRLPIHNIPWTQENELKVLGKLDLGLMPSDRGDFNCFRFSRKYLIYGAARVPTLASDNGQNHYQIRDGENGLLYSLENDGFLERCRAALLDPKLLKQLGEAAYQDVKAHYDLPVVGRGFVALLRQELGEVAHSGELASCVSFG